MQIIFNKISLIKNYVRIIMTHNKLKLKKKWNNIVQKIL